VRAAQKSNRQVTVLLGASVLWTALRDIEMFGVLASAAKHTTVVVAAPEDRSQEDLRSVATQMNASGPMANVIVEKCED
jgi:hypothetical protein